MWEAIGKVIGWFTDYFSPERKEKRLRTRREEIKKELRQLKKQEWSEALSRKVEKLEEELDKINNILGA